jgi:hypothetical protein
VGEGEATRDHLQHELMHRVEETERSFGTPLPVWAPVTTSVHIGGTARVLSGLLHHSA